MNELSETETNLIAQNTISNGELVFTGVTRFFGKHTGSIRTTGDSILSLGESAFVEGDIEGSSVIIQGTLKGNIKADKKIIITYSGRVIGNLDAPSVTVDFGAYFEGECKMQESQKALKALGTQAAMIQPNINPPAQSN